MKKTRIVIASVLKPVDDTRMYEKFAASLRQTGKYELHVIGYPTTSKVDGNEIKQWPLPRFPRISFQRIFARWRIFFLIQKIRPELLIITTHELLFVAVVAKIQGVKIIYDVQENYYRNIRNTSAFPLGSRTLLAFSVRLKEKLTCPFIDHYLIAEKSYSAEFNFIRKKFSVVENKCILPREFQRQPSPDVIELLFSGTLDTSTGVFAAIDLAVKLHDKNPAVTLHIVGYAARSVMFEEIRSTIEPYPFIQLTGGDTLQPHEVILASISTGHAGIVSYLPSSHTQNSIPTKVYEYMAAGLPILLSPNDLWESVTAPFHAAVVVDFNSPDVPFILHRLTTKSFYGTGQQPPAWGDDVPALLAAIEKTLH